MLSAIAFVPSAPLLVPELMRAPDAPVQQVRSAVAAAGRWLGGTADSWLIVGAAGAGDVAGVPGELSEAGWWEPRIGGSFIGFGVDVPVRLGPAPAVDFAADLPLAVLVGAWVRTAFAPEVPARAVLIRAESDARACEAIGRRLACELEKCPERVGVLVVADGATVMPDREPGKVDDSRERQVQARITSALADGDRSALLLLDEDECRSTGVNGRAAWQVAAAVAETLPLEPALLYSGSPYGVAYVVATWATGEQAPVHGGPS